MIELMLKMVWITELAHRMIALGTDWRMAMWWNDW